ncbi:uncharacterized protein LOC115576845 [Sparus aurata]|uniref:uncharacterized protein LOC115576845 n=1 Tax=Sparus aurata TaxID=8175 RepID=UPI0011C10400|nr:uncharacterized protein LOC115576845 [Sparus aurata]
MQCLERGKRPSPRLRREMVWIVVTEMMKARDSPNTKASTEVAKKKNDCKVSTVTTRCHRKDVVGLGYHSLVMQSQAGIENVKRTSTPRIKKRNQGSDDCDTDEVPAEQRAAMQDTYGCIKWEMKYMLVSETPESQQERKDKMKALSEQTNFTLGKVESLPVTPCIIVCGTSCYASRQFMLSVDGKVVNDHIPNFISAICLMFGTYYCLNTHYPMDLGSTRSFIGVSS